MFLPMVSGVRAHSVEASEVSVLLRCLQLTRMEVSIESMMENECFDSFHFPQFYIDEFLICE
jgi:hypothetical protein